MTRQDALRECSEWLVACLDIGWRERDLDELERIWWRWHDEHGRLLKTPRKK